MSLLQIMFVIETSRDEELVRRGLLEEHEKATTSMSVLRLLGGEGEGLRAGDRGNGARRCCRAGSRTTEHDCDSDGGDGQGDERDADAPAQPPPGFSGRW